MRVLILFGLLSVFAATADAVTLDPVGDTYGTGMQFDIVSVSGVTNAGSTTFEIRFASPVPASLDEHLWGAIEIDVDRNAATGKNSELDYPNMNFPLGVDYVIAYYYGDDPGSVFILDVTNDKLFSMPAEFGANYFRITVPVVGSQSDLVMHYAVGVGDGQSMASPYSDIAGNGYQVLSTTATPEPATLALTGGALVLAGLLRARRRVSGD